MDGEKFFELHEVDGVWWGPNACKRCEKWFPPYMAGVPMDIHDQFCWGHAIEDAVAPWKELLKEILLDHAWIDQYPGYLAKVLTVESETHEEWLVRLAGMMAT